MLPILDDHAHLCPWGKRSEAVRQFKDSGGTHLIISHMPYESKPIISKNDWLEEFKITISLTREAERETGVRTFCVVGPYPVDLLGLSEKLGLDEAVQLMRDGVDVAADLVEQQEAVGIGEIGRPHFEVDTVIMEKSNEITRLCMEKAKDLDCAVVIHSEHPDERNMLELGVMAKEIGLRPEQVVKHFCGKLERGWQTGGLSLSILATKDNVLSAIDQDLNFMMETDYLDDPTRPGAVLSLATVPKRTRQLFEEGKIDEKLWAKIHIDRPRLAYGLDTEI
ncbi:MAG: TatD family hydrolase [Thermoplasmata archaeon]|nr:TatD family hydrolase [Thermoplasmata archaeon]